MAGQAGGLTCWAWPQMGVPLRRMVTLTPTPVDRPVLTGTSAGATPAEDRGPDVRITRAATAGPPEGGCRHGLNIARDL